MTEGQEIKYLNQCFQCLKVIKPRPTDSVYSYSLRRYCGKTCVDIYSEAKRKFAGKKK